MKFYIRYHDNVRNKRSIIHQLPEKGGEAQTKAKTARAAADRGRPLLATIRDLIT